MSGRALPPPLTASLPLPIMSDVLPPVRPPRPSDFSKLQVLSLFDQLYSFSIKASPPPPPSPSLSPSPPPPLSPSLSPSISPYVSPYVSLLLTFFCQCADNFFHFFLFFFFHFSFFLYYFIQHPQALLKRELVQHQSEREAISKLYDDIQVLLPLRSPCFFRPFFLKNFLSFLLFLLTFFFPLCRKPRMIWFC